MRFAKEEPLIERVRGVWWLLTLEGGPSVGIGEGEGEEAAAELGSDNRYQLPVYVRAISWNSFAGSGRGAVLFSWVDGASIHPTVHFSSSAASASG